MSIVAALVFQHKPCQLLFIAVLLSKQDVINAFEGTLIIQAAHKDDRHYWAPRNKIFCFSLAKFID